MTFIDNLNWRYATKKFDGRKLPDNILEKILLAIRMSPSSFGIQPYHVSVVSNGKLKLELNGHAFWDQKQISTCSHVLIFSADSDILRRAADFIALAKVEGRKDIYDDPEFDYVKGVVEFGARMKPEWAAKQAYLALGFAMAACAELQIDSCPMEAVNFGPVKEALSLPSNLEPKFVLAIGYRDPDDEHAKDKKIRFSDENIFDFEV